MMVGTLVYYIVSLVLDNLIGDIYVNNFGLSILEILA